MDAAATLTAVIAAVSALVALVALYFTRKQVVLADRQTRLQEKIREDQSQPFVWADIRPDDRQTHLMRLLICNEGPTVATDVSVTFDPPLPTPKGSGPDEQRRWTVVGMPPGRRMSWAINTGPDWLGGDLAKRFTVSVTAHGPFGQVTPLVYDLDVSEYSRVSASPPGTLYGVTRQLKELTAALKQRR